MRISIPILSIFLGAFYLIPAYASTADEGRSAAYREATRALDEARWDEAAAKFAAVAETKGDDADAALYWKAYAESKAGRRAEARRTVRALESAFPDSAWLDDAAALGLEPPQAPAPPVPPVAPKAPKPPKPPKAPSGPGPHGGVATDVENPEEELQLYALDGLMHMDSEKALPILEQILTSDRSPRLKERALFVLGQSDSPRARQILVETARSGRPESLQLNAVRSLGISGDAADIAALSDIYAGSGSPEVKATVLEAFMIAGEQVRILAAAKAEADPRLRGKAIEMLGVMGRTDALAELYDVPGSVPNRAKILEAMMIAGDQERILELARREANPELRMKSIEMLGVMGATKDLLQLYDGAADRAQKTKIIEALFIAGDGEALVSLLRRETDVQLKKEMVQRLSMMGDDAATEELLRILGAGQAANP
jgi:HEAT repeat protein